MIAIIEENLHHSSHRFGERPWGCILLYSQSAYFLIPCLERESFRSYWNAHISDYKGKQNAKYLF